MSERPTERELREWRSLRSLSAPGPNTLTIAYRVAFPVLLDEYDRLTAESCTLRERVRELERLRDFDTGALELPKGLMLEHARLDTAWRRLVQERDQALRDLASERSRREKAEALTARWREAAIAFQALNTCYRIGNPPSEKLFSELEKGRALMNEDPKP